MRKLTLLTMLLAFAVTNGVAFGQKISNPVTSTIANADGAFASYSLQSDLLGSYLNGTGSVVSQIQGIGDWELDMLASPTRRVNVSFDDPVSIPPLPAPPSGNHPVRFITQCGSYGFNLLNLATVGQTATCGLIVAVDDSGIRYSLRFYASNFPGSDSVTVACTSVASGKCSGWRMQSPNGTGKLIAQVYKVTTVRGKTVNVDYGKYRFSFDMSFTKP